MRKEKNREHRCILQTAFKQFLILIKNLKKVYQKLKYNI